MNLFGIIFYIIIIAIFINAKRAAKSDNENVRGHNRTNPVGNYSGQTSRSSSKRAAAGPNEQNKEKKVLPNVPEREPAVPNVSERKPAVPNVPVKKKTERTSMEPHKEETWQPKIRTNNLWGEDKYAGRRIVALRLMEGDPVPEGYIKVRCPYCAADNLVTKHCKQYHSCYFCRVPID